MKSEYSMQDILKKSMEANMEKKKRVEEEMNADTAGKRITRNQILKSCEQEENFKHIYIPICLYSYEDGARKHKSGN